MPPLVVLITAWLLLIVYAFPGQITQDSLDHLVEARTGVYTDGHPPVLSLLFKVADTLIAGPFGMLVLQATLVLAGLYLVMRRVFSQRRAAWISAALFVFPPVMLPLAVIWKDCLMAGFLLLGVGGLLGSSRGVKLAGLAAMFAATAVRYNAPAATLPLIVMLFDWTPGIHWVKRYGLATLAWLAITLAAFGINGALTDKKMHLWHASLGVFDIVGTLAHVDEDIPDAELQQLFAGSELHTPKDLHATARALYNPREYIAIIVGNRAMWTLPLYGPDPAPKPQRDAIERAWSTLVKRYPFAYLEHRLNVMAEVLWLTSPHPGAVPARGVKFPEIAMGHGLGVGWSRLQMFETRWLKRLDLYTPLFTPWVYVVLALILLPLARRQRDVLALLLSGLVMEGSLLLFAATRDYRYSHWMIVATCVAIGIVTARRARAT